MYLHNFHGFLQKNQKVIKFLVYVEHIKDWNSYTYELYKNLAISYCIFVHLCNILVKNILLNVYIRALSQSFEVTYVTFIVVEI